MWRSGSRSAFTIYSVQLGQLICLYTTQCRRVEHLIIINPTIYPDNSKPLMVSPKNANKVPALWFRPWSEVFINLFFYFFFNAIFNMNNSNSNEVRLSCGDCVTISNNTWLLWLVFIKRGRKCLLIKKMPGGFHILRETYLLHLTF